MGEAKKRGTYEERRDQRLNEMVEQAEILIALRVEDGKLVLSSLARDNPVDEDSAAVGFAEYLLANWRELAGQALALKSTALAGAAAARPDIADGIVVMPNGLPAAAQVDRDPVILGANGGVISSANDDGPRIELPASVRTVADDEADPNFIRGD